MSVVDVIHGPNLNLLGRREPSLYGATTLAEIDAQLRALGAELGLRVESYQSNQEGLLVDRVQACLEHRGPRADALAGGPRADALAGGPHADALIINPGAYTHTSVALRDALLAVRDQVWVVEVHLTIPAGREPFRQQNLLSDVVHGRVEGFGADSYRLALRAASALIASRGD